jgi:hypothetical protein
LTRKDGSGWYPSSCANGRYTVFSILGHGGAKALTIWRIDAGGRNFKQLSDGLFDEFPVCSPMGNRFTIRIE